MRDLRPKRSVPLEPHSLTRHRTGHTRYPVAGDVGGGS